MIIIFDHTIENKDEIKQAIEQLQSINPLLQEDIKYLDVDYSNQAIWDYEDELEASTQHDKRYQVFMTLFKVNDDRLIANNLVDLIRQKLLRKISTLGDWWTIITNNPISTPIEYYSDDYDLATNYLQEFDKDRLTDKKFEIDGEIVTIKAEEQEIGIDNKVIEFVDIYGMYMHNRGVIISQHNLTVQQLVKVYDHEWGHTMIEEHCDVLGCSMNAMYEAEDIDLTASFCETCQNELLL